MRKKQENEECSLSMRLTEGERIFVFNHLEPDLHGFGTVLLPMEVKYEDDIVLVQINHSGECQETADRVYKLVPRRICRICGCALVRNHPEDTVTQPWPYYCPYCDLNMDSCHTQKVSQEEYEKCLTDSAGRFLPDDDHE